MNINKDLALKLVKELVAKGSARPKESESNVAQSELSEIRKQGIEGIIFGTAQLEQAHKSNEYITLERLNTGTLIFEQFLQKWK